MLCRSRFGCRLENPPLPDSRSALVSLAHFTGVGSLRATAAVHDHPTVPRTHRRALASYGDTLTTPSPAGYYVNIPSFPPSSLRSSLPLIQQLPAGLVHAESPEYCWPGGSSASLKQSMAGFEI